MSVNKTYNIISYTLLLLVFISCATKQNIVKEDVEKLQPNKILFLNYSIKKLANGEKDVSIINQITAKGKLKNSTQEAKEPKIEDLEYSILDQDSKLLEKQTIDNPLVKVVEYVNNFGNFEKRIIELDSAQFSIRTQLNSKAKHIIISEFTQNGTKKHITIKIE